MTSFMSHVQERHVITVIGQISPLRIKLRADQLDFSNFF